jgi:hypothetical protein
MRKRQKSFARNGNDDSGNGKAPEAAIVREPTDLSLNLSLSPAEAVEGRIQ